MSEHIEQGKLLPCPFCGEIWSVSDHDAEYYELKHKKPCFFGDDLMLIKFSEMANWNTRKHPQASRKEQNYESLTEELSIRGFDREEITTIIHAVDCAGYTKQPKDSRGEIKTDE